MAVETRSLRILHLTAGSDAGGVSRYLRNLCDVLATRGHEITVAGERGAWHDHFHDTNWRWVEAPLKAGFFTLRNAGSKLAADSYDIVHAHFRKAALAGRVVAKKQQIPMLFTLHLTGIPMTFPWSWLSDFGDHTHAPSAAARDWLTSEAGVDQNNITVIPHGLDAKLFPVASDDEQRAARVKLGLPTDATIAGFVGRFDEPKNEQWMVDLAEASFEKLPDLHILLVGEGPRARELQNRVSQSAASDRITILDYCDPLPVYQAIDALLLPSSLEGFSYVCLEAMSVGRPVLRTKTAGTEEMILPNVTGESVDINKETFVQSAIRFLSDRSELRRMGTEAARHTRAELSLEKQVAATLHLYEKLIRESR